jgi:hypothetical protein
VLIDVFVGIERGIAGACQWSRGMTCSGWWLTACAGDVLDEDLHRVCFRGEAGDAGDAGRATHGCGSDVWAG